MAQTNRDLIESGNATDQQLDIESAVDELNTALDNVVENVVHYAVEDLRSAIRQYYRSSVIKTKDVK